MYELFLFLLLCICVCIMYVAYNQDELLFKKFQDAELSEKQAEAERRIQKARQQALSSVRQVAAEAARAATNRLIGVEPSQADADSAIDGKG